MNEASGRLLVVDDLQENLDLMHRRLTRRGYDVAVASSGQKCIDLITQDSFDLVLLDIMMPGMSGLEVLEQLRKTWGRSALPIIMVSAKSESQDMVGALELGANDYITKPVDFPVAIARIETALALRRADAALRESQERFALAMEGAMITVSASGLVETYSQAAKALFGYEADATLGQSLETLLSVGDQGRFDGTSVMSLLERITGGDQRAEVIGRHVNGDDLALEVSALLHKVNDSWCYLLCLRDISARKSAERVIGEAKEHLASAFANMSEGFVIWDRDDRLLACNERFRETEETADLPIHPGLAFSDLVTAQKAARHWVSAEQDSGAWAEARLAHHRQPAADMIEQLADGRWFRIAEKQLGDGRMIGVLTDITNDVMRAEASKAAKEKAEEASRAKSEFLGTMSHELRTPLNAIIGFSDLIGQEALGPLENESYKSYIDDIHSSGRYLLAIINDVLDISRIESGKVEIDERELDLKDIALSCVEVNRAKAEKGGVVMTLDQAMPSLAVVGDQKLMKQAVLNLVSNAVKFTNDGGSVTIEGGYSEAGDAFIRIADTGIGMEASQLEEVFEPFYQVDAGLNRKFEGTGLGLALAKRFVELHGGVIELASESGVGTTVTLYFPKERTLTDDGDRPVLREAAG